LSELDPAARAAVPIQQIQQMQHAARGGTRDRAPAPPFPDVAVLLGDPRLPDPVKRTGLFAEEDFEAFVRMKAALAEVAERRGFRVRYLEDHGTLLADLAGDPPSFVLNFCDTGFRNDAARELHLPAYLELLGIPYSGAGPVCLGLCYDKALVRSLALTLGIPVPEELAVGPAGDPRTALDGALDRWGDRFPALVKPSVGDGSVGITKDAVVRSRGEARTYLEGLRRTLPGRVLLIQEYLEGAEYGIGLIGNPSSAPNTEQGAGDGLTALPPMEVDFGRLPPELPPILSYESKAEPDSPYYTDVVYREASLDAETRDLLVERSALLFERLGCRDYARFDFRADASGAIKLLEVNPNPAWCWDGKMCFMAGFAGWSYPDLLERILDAAQRRAAGAPGPPAG
jgi:D-alanine-D-alanine ligase